MISLTINGVKIKKNLSEGMNPETYIGHQLVYPGDLVICLRDLDGPLLVGISEHYGCTSNLYVVLQLDDQNLDYYNYVFKTMDFLRVIDDFSYGMRHSYNISQFSQLRVPAPQLIIQNIIVQKLKLVEQQIDKLIKNQQQQIEKLKEYKQSLISEVVTKGLDLNVELKDSGIDWIGKIPVHWDIDRLKYVATSNDESLASSIDSSSTIEYVDIGSVSHEIGIEKTEIFTFNEAPSRARRITRINDILVSTVRTYLKAIAVVDRDNLIASTGFSVIRANQKINNTYLCYYIKSDYFTERVSAYSNGISYPAINDSILMSFDVVKPPLDEQEKTSIHLKNKVNEIDKLVSIKEEKIEKLNAYKKSLIYEYVTGKKEVS